MDSVPYLTVQEGLSGGAGEAKTWQKEEFNKNNIALKSDSLSLVSIYL